MARVASFWINGPITMPWSGSAEITSRNLFPDSEMRSQPCRETKAPGLKSSKRPPSTSGKNKICWQSLCYVIILSLSWLFRFMRKKNNNHQKDIDDLKRQNSHLEAQIRALERAKASGQFSSAQEVKSDGFHCLRARLRYDHRFRYSSLKD